MSTRPRVLGWESEEEEVLVREIYTNAWIWGVVALSAVCVLTAGLIVLALVLALFRWKKDATRRRERMHRLIEVTRPVLLDAAQRRWKVNRQTGRLGAAGGSLLEPTRTPTDFSDLARTERLAIQSMLPHTTRSELEVFERERCEYEEQKKAIDKESKRHKATSEETSYVNDN